MRRVVLTVVCAVFGVAVAAGTAHAQTQTLPFDHIHVNVPDTAAAANWYEKSFGGRRITEAPDRLMFGSTRFMFIKKADALPSSGSAVDHIGFSVANLDATLKEFEAAGIKIVAPARDVTGLFKLAFVEDPWGTRIEVVEDPSLLGFHHIHLRGPDPEQIFAWLLAKVGGERTPMKGRLDAVKYSVPGFSDVWVLVQKGESVPSLGHALDHVGWRATRDLTQTIAELKAKGVNVTSEPRPMTMANGSSINFAYVDGPAGVRVELVERPGLKPGQ